jgi:amino acid transporter
VSLIVLATASPTLARQFNIVIDVTVVISLLVYLAACLALLRLGAGMARGMRGWSSLLAIVASVFCVALIWSSESDLLIWSAAAAIIGVLAYVPVRMLRPVAPAALPG